jgi:hypothetical protein
MRDEKATSIHRLLLVAPVFFSLLTSLSLLFLLLATSRIFRSPLFSPVQHLFMIMSQFALNFWNGTIQRIAKYKEFLRDFFISAMLIGDRD